MNTRVIGRILVVDDQQNWRDALVSILAKEGHTVRTVGSFKEAIEEVSQVDLDLLVLDVRLEDSDIFDVQGLEILKRAKAMKASVGVIILTGYPESIRDDVLNRYGADALILKVPPGSRFDSEGFRQMVQQLVRKAQGN